MRSTLCLFSLLLLCAAASAQGVLTPLDFGLHKADHGRIDYVHTPPGIFTGYFNNDSYPDIARFSGNRLDVYVFSGGGYSPRPQGTKIYSQPIKSLALGGDPYTVLRDLVVTLQDGSADTLRHHGGCLDLQIPCGFLPDQSKLTTPPRRVSDFDFQIVWQSEPHPYGMDRCAVGDLDNDGINELVTWWKEFQYADSAYILIYKATGDNQYDLFMQEPFWTPPSTYPSLTYLLIDDVDQNGYKELIYTKAYCYFWEFTAPGVYHAYQSTFNFQGGLLDMKVSDLDNDNIKEITFVSEVSSMPYPGLFSVEEFSNKNGAPWNEYVFVGYFGMIQDWIDSRLAVGDFDNDGAQDIVAGNSSWSTGDPCDIEYFRYNGIAPWNFSTEWLHTGSPLTCANPVIADLDGDGQNELFAGGLHVSGGSAFVWEATGTGTGYVSWQDTSNSPTGPNESTFGIVDDNPSVVSTFLAYDPTENTRLLIWSRFIDIYNMAWISPPATSSFYSNPIICDIDADTKQDIITANFISRQVSNWELIINAVIPDSQEIIPASIHFYPPFPNPFNESTSIRYALERRSDVTIEIYNLQGKTVFSQKEEGLNPGAYQVRWNASGLPSGIYFIHLISGIRSEIKKAILLK